MTTLLFAFVSDARERLASIEVKDVAKNKGEYVHLFHTKLAQLNIDANNRTCRGAYAQFINLYTLSEHYFLFVYQLSTYLKFNQPFSQPTNQTINQLKDPSRH